jgi:segregation and condensation protein B
VTEPPDPFPSDPLPGEPLPREGSPPAHRAAESSPRGADPASGEGDLSSLYAPEGALRAESVGAESVGAGSVGAESEADADEAGELAEDGELEAALEAVLLVVDTPAPTDQLADVLGQPVARVAAALESLGAQYTAGERGIELRATGEGWRL